MGYEAQGGGTIRFRRDRVVEAFQALGVFWDTFLSVVIPKPGEEQEWLIEVMTNVREYAPTLVYDYLIGEDPQDNIINLELSHAGKWNDDVDWLKTLAPYIEETEVCIEMHGEDDSTWGYAFVHGELQELQPEIIWPKVLEEPQVTI